MSLVGRRLLRRLKGIRLGTIASGPMGHVPRKVFLLFFFDPFGALAHSFLTCFF